MRGSSKSLPKYSKHKASGQAVVHLSGTDFYLGPHGSKASKLEYDRLIGEWLANGRRLLEVSTEHPITIVEHEHLKCCWPYEELDSVVTSVLADGKIDENEHRFLLHFFDDFAEPPGNRTLENEQVSGAD